MKIVFISGTGRSGTNITKEIFIRHSMVVSLPFEYRFIIDPEGIVDFYNSITSTWSPFMADHKIKKLEAFLKNLSKKSFFERLFSRILKFYDKTGKKITPPPYADWELNRWLPEFETHSDNLINNLKEFEYSGCWPGAEGYRCGYTIYHSRYRDSKEIAQILGDYIYTVIGGLLTSTGKDVFVEDNTWNILFAKELFEMVPDAKLIHVLRDPRDVVASCIRQRWTPSTVDLAVKWYLSIIERWFSIKKELQEDGYTEFKLEDLVANTETVLKTVCEFIDLPFEENLMTVDLSKSNTGRWKEEFSVEEKKKLNGMLDNVIRTMNY